MSVLTIGGIDIKPGETRQIELPVAKLYTDTDISIPVHIKRGKKEGPVLFISAAVHGDELNGIDIIARLIHRRGLRLISGTLIAVPMVNVYGVLSQSRYMPDRRDLNRSFPGSPKGSLAGRVAHTFLQEIVRHCDYGIDLHTGAMHRSNLPQVRANLDDPVTKRLAESFGVPVLLNANLRDGSLREAATEMGTKILLYEAGQALRLDEFSIRVGIRGILSVMAHLGMIKSRSKRKQIEPFIAFGSSWIRADASGFVRYVKNLGDQVSKHEIIAEIYGPFGDTISKLRSHRSGIIIGKQNIPLAQEGDAMFHVAYFKEDDEEVVDQIEELQSEMIPEVKS